MAESKLYPGEQIIDDSTPDSHFDLTPDGMSKGYQGMFRSQQSADELTVPFPAELLIPQSDWQGWIEETEARKSRVSDLVTQAGLPCKDQASTNFCWANAPVHLLEVSRVIQNQTMVILSPASVACPINNFRNQGGWGEDALRQLITDGAVPVSKWPANAIQKQYYTEANIALAKSYRAAEWWNLRPKNINEHISCLLRRIPVAVGLNYWGHEVSDYEAVWVNGKIGVRFRNSWTMNWPTQGAGGYSIRQGNKLPADDAVAIRTGTAS
ncbi:MAG: C1 family peptidase [Planctomycetota bacterium]